MRVPGKVNGTKQDGANQNMGMYSKESAFTRKMHLQEALNKVEGRIATIIGKLQQAEETEARMKLERERDRNLQRPAQLARSMCRMKRKRMQTMTLYTSKVVAQHLNSRNAVCGS